MMTGVSATPWQFLLMPIIISTMSQRAHTFAVTRPLPSRMTPRRRPALLSYLNGAERTRSGEPRDGTSVEERRAEAAAAQREPHAPRRGGAIRAATCAARARRPRARRPAARKVVGVGHGARPIFARAASPGARPAAAGRRLPRAVWRAAMPAAGAIVFSRRRAPAARRTGQSAQPGARRARPRVAAAPRRTDA